MTTYTCYDVFNLNWTVTDRPRPIQEFLHPEHMFMNPLEVFLWAFSLMLYWPYSISLTYSFIFNIHERWFLRILLCSKSFLWKNLSNYNSHPPSYRWKVHPFLCHLRTLILQITDVCIKCGRVIISPLSACDHPRPALMSPLPPAHNRLGPDLDGK